MDRKDKIFSKINRTGRGLEIGASFAPIAPKKEGYQTHVIDHLPADKLIEKYSVHDMPVENVEPVDFVWNGESYAELTGNRNYYDWIIASHLIEHTPDLIGFINGCQEVLKDDGVLSLVVPDARFCFDSLRPITGISKIIDAHVHGDKVHTVGTIAEFALNAVRKNGSFDWNEKKAGNDSYSFSHTSEQSSEMIDAAEKKTYVDAHCWCFTPTSFRLIIHDLNALGLIELKELDFFPTDGCEFYISLGKHGSSAEIDRLDYLKKIREESWADIKLSTVIEKRVKDKINFTVFRLKNSLKYRLSTLKKLVS
jgi:hypothetical protein